MTGGGASVCSNPSRAAAAQPMFPSMTRNKGWNTQQSESSPCGTESGTLSGVPPRTTVGPGPRGHLSRMRCVTCAVWSWKPTRRSRRRTQTRNPARCPLRANPTRGGGSAAASPAPRAAAAGTCPLHPGTPAQPAETGARRPSASRPVAGRRCPLPRMPR